MREPIATRDFSVTGEFAIVVGAERIFCRVNSERDDDADRVVAAINASREGEPVWPRDDGLPD